MAAAIEEGVMPQGAGHKDPPIVSGALPLAGHLVEFLRSPEGLFWRGEREHGRLFGFRLPGRRAVMLLGQEHHRFFFANTDRLLSISEAYPFFTRMFSPDFYYFGGATAYERQREIILPRFQGRQLEGYAAVMRDETDQFADSLGAEGEFDLTAALGPLVMRIAARCFLGADIVRYLERGFFEEFRRFSEGMVFLPGWLPLPGQIRSRRARDRLRASLTAVLQARRADPLAEPDFLQHLAQAKDRDGRPVPDLILVNLVLLLVWAGHETTTGQLAWAIADLLAHERDLARVRAEIASEDGAGNRHSRHLDHCLLESERLHPVAYVMARMAGQPFVLDGYTVSKGTLVFICPAVSHRLADEYDDADSYLPERYARGQEGRRARQALIGFGGGVHRCLGVHFAYQEMHLILATLLARFDLELIDPEPRPVAGGAPKWPVSPCRVRYRGIASPVGTAGTARGGAR